MKVLAARGWGLRGRLALLAAVLALTGCRTAAPFAAIDTSGPGWRVQQGQALWKPRPSYPEIAGELLLARHDSGCFMVQFAKTPFTLVTAQVASGRWGIEFPPRKLAFSGRGQPPVRFGWLHLPAALAAQPPRAPWRWTSRPGEHWRLENPRTGESIEGFLSP